MSYFDLGYESYTEYRKSPEFQRLRDAVGVGIKYCERCKKERVRVPHHLDYDRVGNERKGDVVGVCHLCHSIAQYYDNGVPVPMQQHFLIRRWKQVNSWQYKLWEAVMRTRPSKIMQNLWDAYKIED